jgi:hypothetical protein
MSFQDQLANDLAKAFLNSSEFAETLTYVPVGKPRRQIAATVDRSLLQRRPGGNHTANVDEIKIFTYTDATLGIDDPQLGDAVILAGDTEAQKFDFDHREHLSCGALVLKYKRTKMQRAGFSKQDQL